MISAKRLPRNITVFTREMKYACGMRTWSGCTGLVKDPVTGEVSEVHCTYDRKRAVVTLPTDAK